MFSRETFFNFARINNKNTMNDLFNIFSNLGFPIAVCTVLFYIVFKQNNEIQKAIENNTKAIFELSIILKERLNNEK